MSSTKFLLDSQHLHEFSFQMNPKEPYRRSTKSQKRCGLLVQFCTKTLSNSIKVRVQHNKLQTQLKSISTSCQQSLPSTERNPFLHQHDRRKLSSFPSDYAFLINQDPIPSEQISPVCAKDELCRLISSINKFSSSNPLFQMCMVGKGTPIDYLLFGS